MIRSDFRRRGGVNPRVLLFLAIVLLPVLGVGYIAVSGAMSGGVRELPDGTVFVDLKRMSDFDFHPAVGTIEDVPEQWRQLDGERVVLEGQMWEPSRVDGGVKDFELVYSIDDCCFSGEPKIQHFVQASVNDGNEVRYHGDDYVRVVGTLKVDVTRENGRVNGVYHLAVDDVEPL
jgi:hypothetical protein